MVEIIRRHRTVPCLPLKNLLFSSIKVREFKMAESIAKYLIELDSDNSLAIDFLGQCQSGDGTMIDKK